MAKRSAAMLRGASRIHARAFGLGMPPAELGDAASVVAAAAWRISWRDRTSFRPRQVRRTGSLLRHGFSYGKRK